MSSTPFDTKEHADLRVLVASHSHPQIQNGGSEVASYSLFERLRECQDIKSWYCGCSRTTSFARAGQSITQPFQHDEFLYTVGDFEWFKFANRDMAFARDFRGLLKTLRPDIVHFHHYINFGMEAFAYVKEILPDARIILTLHEFLAICHQQGQMVTRQQGSLCRRSGYVECSRCFPEMQSSDFFVREAYIRHFLNHVDHFIAPSHFLAQRYVEWGIAESRISVIENIPTTPRSSKESVRASPSAELRVGFFGQISLLKGIQVLIDAASILEQEHVLDISFTIFGDHTNQPQAFQAEFLGSIERAGSNVAFHGAYANSDVDDLMAEVDIVLVPSIWWENSPVVIQEAFRNGRPVVCSNIGGMAEKIMPGVDGMHFQVGNPRSLVNVLKGLAAKPELMDELRSSVGGRQRHRDPLAEHLSLYRNLSAAAPNSETIMQRSLTNPSTASFAVP